MTTTTTDPLAAFVGRGDETSRYEVGRIWNDGRFRCATDTHIGAVEPSDDPKTPTAKGPFPPVVKFIEESFGKTAGWVPMPKLPKPTGDPCRDCDGKGAFVACKECDGEGVKICPTCDHEEDCRPCKTKGRFAKSGGDIRCDVCGGSGEIVDTGSLELLGRKFAVNYLRKIATLPGVEIAMSTSKPGGVLAFRSGNIRGALMSLHG